MNVIRVIRRRKTCIKSSCCTKQNCFLEDTEEINNAFCHKMKNKFMFSPKSKGLMLLYHHNNRNRV